MSWNLKKFGFMHQRLLPHSHTSTWHVCPVFFWHQYNCKTYKHSINKILKDFWSKILAPKNKNKWKKLDLFQKFLQFSQLLIHLLILFMQSFLLFISNLFRLKRLHKKRVVHSFFSLKFAFSITFIGKVLT